MKLVQFFRPGKGKRVGLVQGDRVLDITSSDEGVGCTLDLVIQGKTAQGMVTRGMWLAKRLHRKALDWRELQRSPSRRAPHLLVPIDPPEVWGAKGTYAPELGQAGIALASGDAPATPAGAMATRDRRPALFFKATAYRVVGPNAPIMLRSDSKLTVPEAGLAVVLGAPGAVVAFTACNDVTARDIEEGGPEFLSQAKVYAASCALGPCLVTADEVEDPYGLQVRCSIIRNGETIFSEATRTARLHQPIDEMVAWLCKDNPILPATVLSTGTGLVVPNPMALSDGDQVHIEVQGIGRLSNPVRRT